MNEAPAAALTVQQTIQIDATPERVFELLTDVEQIPQWMPVTVFEPWLGGRVEFVRGEWHMQGEVTEFDRPRAVAYTWDWRNQPLGVRTEVRWELEAQAEVTIVRLSHTGLRDSEQREDHGHGWSHYGARLRAAAEGGDPGPDDLEPRR